MKKSLRVIYWLEIIIIAVAVSIMLFFEYYFHSNWFDSFSDLFAEVSISLAIVAMVVHLVFVLVRHEGKLVENSQAQLSGILQSMYEDVFTFDKNKKLIFCHISGNPQHDFGVEPDVSKVPAKIHEILEEGMKKNKGGDLFYNNYDLFEEDGEKKYYSVLFTPYYIGEEYSGSVVVVYDETESIKSRNELEKAHHDLQKQFDILKKFEQVAVGRELKMVELKKKIKKLSENKIKKKIGG